MKKNSTYFDDYSDYLQPKSRKRDKQGRSNQISFSELDYEEYQPIKKRKNVNLKQY